MAEAKTEPMPTTMPRHGEFCWSEIATNDLEACKKFYATVFGWEMPSSRSEGIGTVYQEFNLPGEYPMGGMYAITKEMFGEHMPPPHFINYISVDNVDESTRKASELGATIIKPAMDIPKVGRFSIIQDPTGAHVALITLAQM